jgi:hypothetical protein
MRELELPRMTMERRQFEGLMFCPISEKESNMNPNA